jgi:hypothetical protein
MLFSHAAKMAVSEGSIITLITAFGNKNVVKSCPVARSHN